MAVDVDPFDAVEANEPRRNAQSKRERRSNGLYNVAVGMSWVAVASSDETVKLFRSNARPLEPASEVATPHDEAVALAFSPTDSFLALGTRKGGLLLVDPTSNRKLHESQPHANTVTSVTFSSDGRVLATGAYDHRIRLWRVSNEGLEPILDLPEQSNRILKVAFGPKDESLFVLVQNETALRQFNLVRLRASLKELQLGW